MDLGLKGTKVLVTGASQGIVEGIAPGGELMLRTTHGVENLIQADEVRILG